jgi:hypothetical protein
VRGVVERVLVGIEDWAEAGTLNPLRLLVMHHPALTAAERAAFDAVLEQTPDGGDVRYDLPQPKWWFLHHAVERGFLLHGTTAREATELRTHDTGDAYGLPVTGLFATDDAIWPLYFATVNRANLLHGYINTAVRVGRTSRYLFSIGADPRDPASWTTGSVFLLPAGTFRRTRDTRELISEVPVAPRARLEVEPADFPFREDTLRHHAGDTPRRVVLRHALRLSRRARRRAA